MDIRKLQRVIVDALDDVKAHDIRVFNTSEQTGMFDRVIVATGTSNRQTRALASHVREKTKAAGGHVISTEGEETGEWVLVDLGDAVVHIMQPAIRVYYNLEELWGSKPVQIKRSSPAGSSRTHRKAATGAIGPPAEANGPAPADAEAHKAKKAPARRRVKAPTEATEATEATESIESTETAEATTSEAKANAMAKPPARRRQKEPEGPGETVARPKAPSRARKAKPSEAPALAPYDPQSETATPKRRAPRKAGLG